MLLSKYSSSSTSSLGGKLGWIDEKSVNNNLRMILSNLKINELTDPISGSRWLYDIEKLMKLKKLRKIKILMKKLRK